MYSIGKYAFEKYAMLTRLSISFSMQNNNEIFHFVNIFEEYESYL